MQNAIAINICGHEVTFAPEDCLVCVRYIGRVAYKDLREFAEALYTHPEYDQNWDVLIDMSSAKFDLSYSDLFHYADFVCKDSRRILGATAVVSPSILHFGIGRMYAGVVGDRLGKIRIERTMEPALAWLKKQRDQQPKV